MSAFASRSIANISRGVAGVVAAVLLGQRRGAGGDVAGPLTEMAQALQAQAKTLQAQPKLSYDDALRALESSVKQGLGPTARLQVAGERATVTLKGVSADALAQWLTQSRVNARAAPTEARLVRNAAVSGPTPSASAATWDGSVVMTLPTR